MTAQALGNRSAGLLGPVALSGGIALLIAAPLMRGGNRHIALIVLELLAVVALLALWIRGTTGEGVLTAVAGNRWLVVLLASPFAIALVQLVPLPAAVWATLPGHGVLAEAARAAGAPMAAWRPVSVSPDATAASLLASAPLLAGLLLGYLATLRELRVVLRVVVAMAIAEVFLGLLQVAGGEHSPLFFGVQTFGPPVGTFANRNHFANYLAMALVALVWLGYESHRDAKIEKGVGSFSTRHRTALWAAGGMFLVLGILMSRSRGAAAAGLPLAVLALVAASLRVKGWSRGWRFALPLTLLVVIVALVLIGVDAATSRLTGGQVSASASFRGLLARTSFEGAMAFWPFGSGWGTYDLAYPRFQPPWLPGYANQAHMDYVQLLFEGGILFLALAVVFAWLLGRRAYFLLRRAWKDRTLDRDCMACALCGMGLAVLLLHSLVEFNMRIPANAILGAVLAGAFLRPLPGRRNGNGHASSSFGNSMLP